MILRAGVRHDAATMTSRVQHACGQAAVAHAVSTHDVETVSRETHPDSIQSIPFNRRL